MTARIVIWAPGAVKDYETSLRFPSQQSPEAAAKFADTIYATVASLARRNTGRPGRVDGVFEKSIAQYSRVIAFSYAGETLEIVRIIHTARDWPAGGWPKG